ncbi:NusA-like transcription termination signal-binding factor [archaeon]|nr:NusA-like transcription termination signal-binding factor [archaeon]MBT4417069.1 NusA-like transcription termination signal-binding factor [archaeon]
MIFDQKIMGYINLFERLTRAKVKDCLEEGTSLVFIVQPGEVGKAIGKQGSTIKKVKLKFRKDIKIIEFNPSPEKFLLNLIYPLKSEVEVRDGKLVIMTANSREKGQIYGRERENFKRLSKLVKKYFKLELVMK